MTIQNIEYFKNQVKRLGQALSPGNLKLFHKHFDTIPGIPGPSLPPGITAEIGDISRFDNEASLAQYAGLTLVRYQSGNFDVERKGA